MTMILIGFLVGNIIGFFVACFGFVSIEKKAIKEGYIKLDGEMYEISKIDKKGSE